MFPLPLDFRNILDKILFLLIELLFEVVELLILDAKNSSNWLTAL